MSKKTEWIKARVSPSTKHSLQKINEPMSSYIRDLVERDLNRRELMKDDVKKDAPQQIERLKELDSEIESLESELSTNKARLDEIRKTVDSLESQISKKRSLKSDIIEETKDKTDLDEHMIKAATGDLQ